MREEALLLVLLTVVLWIVSLERSREPSGTKEAAEGKVLLLLDVTGLGAVVRDDESGGALWPLSVRCRLRLPDRSSNGELTSLSKPETSLEPELHWDDIPDRASDGRHAMHPPGSVVADRKDLEYMFVVGRVTTNIARRMSM